jgi:hypothetical protein
MTWWIWTILGVYVVGFVATLLLHLIYLQMVTLGLAMFRATVWPIFWTIGWPAGWRLPMD